MCIQLQIDPWSFVNFLVWWFTPISRWLSCLPTLQLLLSNELLVLSSCFTILSPWLSPIVAILTLGPLQNSVHLKRLSMNPQLSLFLKTTFFYSLHSVSLWVYSYIAAIQPRRLHCWPPIYISLSLLVSLDILNSP